MIIFILLVLFLVNTKSRASQLADLDRLEQEAKILHEIYQKNPTLRNEGEWKTARNKARSLQRHLFPSAGGTAGSTKVDDLEGRIEELESAVERSR